MTIRSIKYHDTIYDKYNHKLNKTHSVTQLHIKPTTISPKNSGSATIVRKDAHTHIIWQQTDSNTVGVALHLDHCHRDGHSVPATTMELFNWLSIYCSFLSKLHNNVFIMWTFFDLLSIISMNKKRSVFNTVEDL